MLAPEVRLRLEELLVVAQAHGALGPGPVGPHIEHASGFAEVVAAPPRRFLDLGSGAGVPGLVLALLWPDTQATLLEVKARRARDLWSAIEEFGLAGCTVLQERAEVVGRDPTHREQYDLVVARSFGPPAVTAECAAPLLRLGGHLVVSEPPELDPARWPSEALGLLGLGAAERRVAAAGAFVAIPKAEPVRDEWPRPTGRPSKSPLWAA